jgi:hypothetical protein
LQPKPWSARRCGIAHSTRRRGGDPCSQTALCPKRSSDKRDAAALALQAVTHGDARWFALNRKAKLSAVAGGVSGRHGPGGRAGRSSGRSGGGAPHLLDPRELAGGIRRAIRKAAGPTIRPARPSIACARSPRCSTSSSGAGNRARPGAQEARAAPRRARIVADMKREIDWHVAVVALEPKPARKAQAFATLSARPSSGAIVADLRRGGIAPREK